jgi:hypothetical protein
LSRCALQAELPFFGFEFGFPLFATHFLKVDVGD